MKKEIPRQVRLELEQIIELELNDVENGLVQRLVTIVGKAHETTQENYLRQLRSRSPTPDTESDADVLENMLPPRGPPTPPLNPVSGAMCAIQQPQPLEPCTIALLEEDPDIQAPASGGPLDLGAFISINDYYSWESYSAPINL
jgi:hypothetical protein